MELDPVKNTVWAKLPFIEDPAANLKPNRFVAERVFKTQLELIRKNPSMREDTVKSHQKLVDRPCRGRVRTPKGSPGGNQGQPR